MELPALHVQGHDVQHGLLQGALRFRLLEGRTADGRCAALDAVPAARKHFDAFSPGKQRDYAEWLAEAKTEATRTRRREQAIAWIAEGKSRNWKYEKC